MARGVLLGLGIVIGVAAAWLTGLAVGPGDTNEVYEADASLEDALRRLENENAELRRMQADRPAPLEGGADGAPPPADGGDAQPAPKQPPPKGATPMPLNRRWRSGPVVPQDIPKALRGKPEMWVEAMRLAEKAGNSAHAHFYMMALTALGPDAVEPLMAVVENAEDRPGLRVYAMTALRSLAPDRMAVVAAGLVESEPKDSALRRQALQLLAQSRPKTVSKTVVDIAYDADAPRNDRQNAMTVVMHADPREAEDLFRQTLRVGTPQEKDLVYRVLAQAERPELKGLIKEAIETAPTNRQRNLLQSLARMKGPGWGDAQMTGEPDTPVGGDNQTAWASRQAQEGMVWVELDFPVDVVPEQVRVHETFNAGAVVRVQVRTSGGDYVTLWTGEARAAGTPRWFAPPLDQLDERIRTVRLTLDTDKVSGWNEIDAVELIGDGRRQWASGARSSSSYARRGG